jgi:hypothetical protein
MAKNTRRVSRKGVKASPGSRLSKESEKKTIRFDYIKSRFFRVIRVDGAHGSPTPKGDGIQIALFSERNPIPQSEEYELTKEGSLSNRIDMKTRGAIVREVEVEAILPIEIARVIEKWLHEKIEQVEKNTRQG